MKNKFEVGQRVGTFLDKNEEFTTTARYDEYGDAGPFYGKVVSTGTSITVKFDGGYLNDDNGTVEVPSSALLPEAEAKEKLSAIEQEFKAVEKQIKAELKIAGQSIRKANLLAKKLGTNLHDMGAGYDHLYSAMDAAGWSTSSFGC